MGPLFHEFVKVFTESVGELMHVPGYEELLKDQIIRDNITSEEMYHSQRKGENQQTDAEIDAEIE